MKMGEGVRVSLGQTWRRAAQPDCAPECTGSEQPSPDADLRSFPLWDFKSRRPIGRSGVSALTRSSARRLIGLIHRALARGAAVDEVLPPSGLVADMVVGVCFESVHYHECQHACFNQEPSSIPNTALLNGKTFQHFNHCSFFIFCCLTDFQCYVLIECTGKYLSGLHLAIYNTYVAKWQIDNLDNERHCLIALSWQPDSVVLFQDIKLNLIIFLYWNKTKKNTETIQRFLLFTYFI